MKGHRRGGNILGEEAGEGKLHIMWGDSVNVVLEGAHGEAEWQKYTSYKGGGDRGGEGPVTYVVYLPQVLEMARCPVTGCPTVAYSAGWLREHFMYRHFFLRISVVQEGREPLLHCNLCDMHMTAGRLIKKKWEQRCERNTQMRWRRRAAGIESRCAEASFRLTGEDEAECIEGVETFKYMGSMFDW